MKLLNKMEKKFGKYAIPNLTVYVLLAYAIGYVFQLMNANVYSMLEMDPALICEGQVWRLFTWVCTVPQEFSIFVIFMFLFYYWIGQTLERNWGTFRYNFYIFSGYLFITIGTMLIYLITGLMMGFENAVSMGASTYYINLASFLAFASMFPDMQVYFMMILPIKIKWLAIVDGVYIGYLAFANLISALNLNGALEKAAMFGLEREVANLYYAEFFSIIFSVLNFVIFFIIQRKTKRVSRAQVQRHKEFKKQAVMRQKITKHKCAICHRTEEDDDTLVFRFCSKCNGNYEYCQEHLFTHEHVK